jgi:uncharacterized repeat protein (TIGR03803 family)
MPRSRPFAPLVIDAKGNLFGTTSTGGNAAGNGTIFAFGNLRSGLLAGKRR